jgi:hypothetical protein
MPVITELAEQDIEQAIQYIAADLGIVALDGLLCVRCGDGSKNQK